MTSATQSSADPTNPDLDADALFAALEAENDLDDPSINPSYRAARLQQLSREIEESKQNVAQRNGAIETSNYGTLKSDPQVLAFTTENSRAIVHFYHPDFARCAAMDQHLEALANAHNTGSSGATVFARVNVQNADFVVQKLGVRVLPCVIGFVDGVAKERLTGFEGLVLGGDEKSKAVTRNIEAALVKAGVLKNKRLEHEDAGSSEEDEDDAERPARKHGIGRRGIQSIKHQGTDDDDDWD